MKKKLIIPVILVALILIVIVCGIILLPKIRAYMPYYYDKTGKNQQDISYTLIIDKNDYENEVAKKLAENDVICSSVRFLNYIHSKHPDFVWYNGVYHLNANMSYAELCEALTKPDDLLSYIKFTIPEGKNVAEIAKIVAQSGLCSSAEFLDAADSYDYDFIYMDELKKRDQSLIIYKLEGFLFPATYEFRADTTDAHDIVAKMLATFEEYVSAELIEKAKKMGLSVNEFVSLAAVIQGEAYNTETMTGVSSVFWNRLNSSAFPRLQSDPTTNYCNDFLKGHPKYTAAISEAYDTYRCSGIPVGAINCPGMDALNSVVAPLDTDYFYFVTDINGKFYFNKNLSGHNQTIQSLKNQGLWA